MSTKSIIIAGYDLIQYNFKSIILLILAIHCLGWIAILILLLIKILYYVIFSCVHIRKIVYNWFGYTIRIERRMGLYDGDEDEHHYGKPPNYDSNRENVEIDIDGYITEYLGWY